MILQETDFLQDVVDAVIISTRSLKMAKNRSQLITFICFSCFSNPLFIDWINIFSPFNNPLNLVFNVCTLDFTVTMSRDSFDVSPPPSREWKINPPRPDRISDQNLGCLLSPRPGRRFLVVRESLTSGLIVPLQISSPSLSWK